VPKTGDKKVDIWSRRRLCQEIGGLRKKTGRANPVRSPFAGKKGTKSDGPSRGVGVAGKTPSIQGQFCHQIHVLWKKRFLRIKAKPANANTSSDGEVEDWRQRRERSEKRTTANRTEKAVGDGCRGGCIGAWREKMSETVDGTIIEEVGGSARKLEQITHSITGICSFWETIPEE